MIVVSRAKSSEQAVKQRKRAGKINLYPLLGMVLAVLLAVLSYGGLLLLLVDDWSFFLTNGQGDARR